MKMFETKRTTHFELIRHSMDVKLGLPKLPDEIIAEKWHPEFFNEVGRMLVRDGIPETWVEDWPEFKQYMKNRLRNLRAKEAWSILLIRLIVST